MKKTGLRFLYSLLFILFSETLLPVEAEGKSVIPAAEVEVMEHQGDYVPVELTFLRSDSVVVTPFRSPGKPVLVTMMVYGCPQNCDALPEGVADLISKSTLRAGTDFLAYTFGLDPGETPSAAGMKQDSSVNKVKIKIPPGAWTFYTDMHGSVDTLARILGIEYFLNGERFFYPHLAVLISPEGKIVKYFYGQLFNVAEFTMAVENANREEVSPTFVKKLNYCLNYSPSVYSRYRLILHLSMAGMLLALFILAILLFREKLRP